MDVSAISSAMDTARVVSDKQLFGAQVVTKTLDYMNSDQFSGSTNSDYDFQKSVLSAAYSGVGTIANTKA
ncbi:hypothetical protein [Desulfovibrio sp. JC010]|uniref:hypothetical protein n=1 Tax=Desulfovibrio sp. JC010 TaxID=2593641 RepID=UPI0013D5BAE7|nr:hypothetical protein [Desulfovibrio sp. JC010]NDV25125.1 hypothetical protein [Desulfovibrio sp. JC010]